MVLSDCRKGAYKYYVSKEASGWGNQMMMFADKVGGWGWPNADMNKKIRKNIKEKPFKKNFLGFFLKFFYAVPFSENFWVGGYEELLTSCLRWV